MLFMVEMLVHIPDSLAPETADKLKRQEKAFSQKLQREGKWPHIWRVVGQYANVSIFDVASNDELHTLLGGLPLFPYMKVSVTPLTQHPSAIAAD